MIQRTKAASTAIFKNHLETQGEDTDLKGICRSNLNVKRDNCQKVLCYRNEHVQPRKGMDFENFHRIKTRVHKMGVNLMFKTQRNQAVSIDALFSFGLL